MNRNDLATTQKAYESHAAGYAKKFDELGNRTQELKNLFNLVPQPLIVLELGCGNGRDAKTIISKARRYVGLDYAPSLLQIARRTAPKGEFVLNDFLTTPFANMGNFSLVIALDSLIHCSDYQLTKVLKKYLYNVSTRGNALCLVQVWTIPQGKQDRLFRHPVLVLLHAQQDKTVASGRIEHYCVPECK